MGFGVRDHSVLQVEEFIRWEGMQEVLFYEPAPALLLGIARICPTSSLVDGNLFIDCSAFVVVPNLFAIFQSESPFLTTYADESPLR